MRPPPTRGVYYSPIGRLVARLCQVAGLGMFVALRIWEALFLSELGGGECGGDRWEFGGAFCGRFDFCLDFIWELLLLDE